MALSDGLYAYYRLDEASGNALDAYGTKSGTVTGATQGVPGVINTGYDFAGTSDRIDFGSAKFPDAFWSGDYSISMWLNADDVTTSANYILWAGTRDVHMRPITDNLVYTNFNGTLAEDVTAPVLIDTLYHVVITMDMGTLLCMYINGELIDTYDTPTTPANQSQNTQIGARANSEGFDGMIDEIGFWTRALTQAEVTQLYNNGNGLIPLPEVIRLTKGGGIYPFFDEKKKPVIPVAEKISVPEVRAVTEHINKIRGGIL